MLFLNKEKKFPAPFLFHLGFTPPLQLVVIHIHGVAGLGGVTVYKGLEKFVRY